MRGIFLCEGYDKAFHVYDAETVCELQALVNIEAKLYAKADIVREPAAFSDVEFIFSTWAEDLEEH